MNTVKMINDAIKEIAFGDGAEAEKTLLYLAKQGIGHAAHELGVLYIVGANGVEPDKKKSKYWLNRSLESGFEASIASAPNWFKEDDHNKKQI